MPGRLLYLAGKIRGAARISLVLRILLLSECALGGGKPTLDPHNLARCVARCATLQNDDGGALRPSFENAIGPKIRIAADVDAASASNHRAIPANGPKHQK
jgi:hypothetical protein